MLLFTVNVLMCKHVYLHKMLSSCNIYRRSFTREQNESLNKRRGNIKRHSEFLVFPPAALCIQCVICCSFVISFTVISQSTIVYRSDRRICNKILLTEYQQPNVVFFLPFKNVFYINILYIPLYFAVLTTVYLIISSIFW